MSDVPKADFRHNLLLINVNETWDKPGLEHYDSVRYSWVISRRRAQQFPYVLAVKEGVVVDAFEATEWLPATDKEFSSIPADHRNLAKQKRRSGFKGRPAPYGIGAYIGKRVPKEYRHHQNPIRYVAA